MTTASDINADYGWWFYLLCGLVLDIVFVLIFCWFLRRMHPLDGDQDDDSDHDQDDQDDCSSIRDYERLFKD